MRKERMEKRTEGDDERRVGKEDGRGGWEGRVGRKGKVEGR